MDKNVETLNIIYDEMINYEEFQTKVAKLNLNYSELMNEVLPKAKDDKDNDVFDEYHYLFGLIIDRKKIVVIDTNMSVYEFLMKYINNLNYYRGSKRLYLYLTKDSDIPMFF